MNWGRHLGPSVDWLSGSFVPLLLVGAGVALLSRHAARSRQRRQGRPAREGARFAGRVFSWEETCQGTIAFGGIGSGKSRSTEALLREYIRAGCPLLSTAVKPDESERYVRLCQRLGAGQRLVLARPGGPHAINLLDELTKPPFGSALGAASFLTNIADAEKRSSGGGRENEGFWRVMEETALFCGIRLCQLALGRASIPDVYRAITTSPANHDEARSEEFDLLHDNREDGTPIRRRFCAKLMVLVERSLKPEDRRDFARIVNFLTDELPAVDKVRGSVIAGISGVLGRFVIDPWVDALSPEVTTLTPEQIERERLIVVLDYPLMSYHVPARLFQTAWVMLTQMYLMRRDAYRVDVPFVIVRDEAGWTLHPEWDSAAHNTLRSQKCASLAIVQCLNTLEAALGGGQRSHHEAMAFASNHMHKLFFANASADTNRWASALVGEHREMLLSGGGGAGKAESIRDESLGVATRAQWSETYRPILRPEQFSQLAVGTAILHANGGATFVDLRENN